MMHPKLIFLVNDWVYNSPIFGKAVQLAGFYPVSGGIEKGVSHLKKKVDEGYSLMAFPEGTRSKTNYIRRFHKGAFYLAEELKLDIIPILIHGNSEVLPKGSFAIKDGKITVEVLKRIPYNSEAYGTSYKEKSKLISQYFKSEFNFIKHLSLTKGDVIAFRAFAGIAIPFGNSDNISFSRSYNSIPALPRAYGPG
jgi:1-acyl-sn-glycerol-3-phosphate acyltransferase